MDGLGEVLDAPEIESGIEEVEEGIEQVEEGAEVVEPPEAAPKESDDPYTTKFSREMRAALKAWEASSPEAAKFAKQARDNHARQFALNQLEPKGIDGVRERYALLDNLMHGELKGPEAIAALQEEAASIAEVDELLASGDPKALDAFDGTFDSGLAKLAPAFLARVQKSDPAAFEAAILPHITQTLAQSDLLKEFNALVDVLNAQGDPRFDDKTKMSFAFQQLSKMGEWFNGLAKRSGEIKAAPAPTSQVSDGRTSLDHKEQEFYWKTEIHPTVASHESKTFDTLFDPYQRRLKLDAAAKADLRKAFRGAMEVAGAADQAYMRQMQMFRKQKNPNPTSVSNFVKDAINRHSKAVMEPLVKARYGPFLAGGPKPKANVQPILKPAGSPAGPGVEIRTVKPPEDEIDFKNTPIQWLREKKYKLFTGKVVQVPTRQ